jgi:glucose/arabinose dehydrogenase
VAARDDVISTLTVCTLRRFAFAYRIEYTIDGIRAEIGDDSSVVQQQEVTMHLPSAVLRCAALSGAVMLSACVDDIQDPLEPVAATSLRASHVECDPDNGGITLPEGFCAVVVADLTMGGEAAQARHMAVTPEGDVFVAINARNNNQPEFGIIGLRDTDSDGRADEQVRFSPGLGGSGIAWGQDRLYFGANDRVLRFDLPSGELMPSGPPVVVVSGLPADGDHISKTVVLDGPHTLFVNIGSASNACQEENRQLESPGVFPCPELPVRAGVWRFEARGTGQTQADGEHYATGLRNMVALAIHPRSGDLFGVQHGRDMLFENWPEFYTVEEDAVLPAEELVRITRGSDNGWPYCYYDAVFEHAKVLAPEYGGDGERVSGGPGIDCATYNQPLVTFGAHWAPNGLHFYRGTQFPARYRHGAFVAFHGGFDRAPLPNEGYQVMFVPFGANGMPTAPPETFADGFAGSDGPLPATAVHRPVGVTEGRDGSLYVSDDRGGRIWRIVYRGN